MSVFCLLLRGRVAPRPTLHDSVPPVATPPRPVARKLSLLRSRTRRDPPRARIPA
jgi:hypothetical protein